ncbi:hypothetical protein AB833_22670 [Chromatiales bacterium (ex Bugula neritina AB1)]|nr:hypothetical protein AB833_22670 [Chromatiales bacterium (ex Bugula neritina AB1)]
MIFYSSDDNSELAVHAIKNALAEYEVTTWPAAHPEKIRYAITWGAPEGFFNDLTGLEAIFSWGAGVDHLFNNPELPDVPVYRLEDAGMADKIADYVLYSVMSWQRNFKMYISQQAKMVWQPQKERSSADYHIGIMGMGVIGSRIAERLATSGYSVSGWKRTPGTATAITLFSGLEQLDEFLQSLDTLVCILPLTKETRQIINQRVFNSIPKGTQFINVGRGEHVVESDLLEALDNGQVSDAVLDVCVTEPLPLEHFLWKHPKVTITPHIAGPTQEMLSAEEVAKGIRVLSIGGTPDGLVDRVKGY